MNKQMTLLCENSGREETSLIPIYLRSKQLNRSSGDVEPPPKNKLVERFFFYGLSLLSASRDSLLKKKKKKERPVMMRRAPLFAHDGIGSFDMF
jgi:hypothetical protein